MSTKGGKFYKHFQHKIQLHVYHNNVKFQYLLFQNSFKNL